MSGSTQRKTAETAPPAATDLSAVSFKVFIECCNCGTRNCFDIPACRPDFKCKGCQADMDAMLATQFIAPTVSEASDT